MPKTGTDTLKSKREDVNDWICVCPPNEHYLYQEEDVKEFIRQLKEDKYEIIEKSIANFNRNNKRSQEDVFNRGYMDCEVQEMIKNALKLKNKEIDKLSGFGE